MTTEQAFNRLKWRISNLKNSAQDVEAFNTILEQFEAQSKAVTNDQTMFAKMMLFWIMERARYKAWTMTQLMRTIEEVMQTPLINLIETFKFETPFYKFELIVSQGTKGLDPLKDFEKIKKIRMQNLKENKKDLEKALKHDWSIDEAVAFIESQVTKLTTKYAENP